MERAIAITIAIWCAILATTTGRAELTIEERQLASGLYKQFSALGDDLAARAVIVGQMLELGSPAARVIQPIIEREWRSASERYRNGFETQAKTLAAKKTSRDRRDRIKKLRSQVQALRSIQGLDKGTIVKIGDPALKELRKLTRVDREEVLASSPALGKAREDLLLLGEQRGACIDALLLDGVEAFDPAALAAAEVEIADASLDDDRDARKILAQNKKLAAEIEPAEADGIRDLNELRMLIGLGPCLIDPRLCAAARDHSKDMKEKNFFDHLSPVPGKTTPWDRAKLAGTSASSENIHMGSSSGAGANRGWWHSPGHHKNMLSPGARRVGMGVAGTHWTQMFGS
jgi:hypothetical protein